MQVFAVTEPNSAVTELTVATPPVAGKEVLLRVLHAGVCHTDTHLRQGGYDLGSRGTLRMTDRGVTYPLVMGHEVVGVVEEVGEDVTAHRRGDVRLIYPWLGCGDCAHCREGRDNHCATPQNLGVVRFGGYARHIAVPDEKYLLDIEGLDPAWAATLACSGLTAFSAANKVLPLPEDDPVVVLGVGGVGLMAVAILATLGHRNICAIDSSKRNLDEAVRLGASTTVLSTSDTGLEDVTAACGGQIAAGIDFVNTSETATLVFDSLRKSGQLLQVGLFGGELTVPNPLMALKMLTVRGSFVGTLDELTRLVAMAKGGTVPRIPVNESELDAAGVQSSLESLTQGGISGRIVLSASPDGE